MHSFFFQENLQPIFHDVHKSAVWQQHVQFPAYASFQAFPTTFRDYALHHQFRAVYDNDILCAIFSTSLLFILCFIFIRFFSVITIATLIIILVFGIISSATLILNTIKNKSEHIGL